MENKPREWRVFAGGVQAEPLLKGYYGDLTLERTVDGWTCFSLSLPAAAAVTDDTVVTEMVA